MQNMTQKLFSTAIIGAMLASCSVFDGARNSSGGSAGSSAGSGGSVGSGSIGSGSFGNKRSEEEIGAAKTAVVDNRGLVPVIKSAKLDRTKDGYILRVIGGVDRTGYYDVELVARNFGEVNADGALIYDFRANVPNPGIDVPTERSKEIYAGVFIPIDIYLVASTISVQALQNNLRVTR
ncbi:hypothetical protein GCM10008927_00860 [Amylibacter ulvae]|uniref:Lipoprotein n=2 Tax=Paramylibacter ulvae TaxID=1651968 RepID=A0ABQ3CRE6_9RHOB|nr:hypothetical protein GCM10008927_00860 [Amylibacter ulvae]